MPTTPSSRMSSYQALPTVAEHVSAPQPRRKNQRKRARRIAISLFAFICFVLSVIWVQRAALLESEDPVEQGMSYNGLARKPVMGWNSWNRFGCDVDEELFLDHAQIMVESGLKAAGYDHVMIDDCWMAKARDPKTSRLVADPVRFPSGIKTLAAKIHKLGLKLGIYSSAGTLTCAGYPASLGYEHIDAQTFADWDIDYLKYDNCYNQGQEGSPEVSLARYKKMSDAILDTGRDMVYSLCSWGMDRTYEWAPTIANSWRMAGDIYDNFDVDKPECACTHANCYWDGHGPGCSVMNIINKAAEVIEYSHEGAFNDLDMLEVGLGNMTEAEYMTHFAMWAIVKSPLLLGNDLRIMDPRTKALLLNSHLLAINQNALGKPARRVWIKDVYGGTLQWWQGPLDHDRYVVAFLNHSPQNHTVNAPFHLLFPKMPIHKIRSLDVWQDGTTESHEHNMTASVPSHGTRVFIMSHIE